MKLKKILRPTLFALTLLSFGFLAQPAATIGCGQQEDGSWDAASETCGGAASNCTNIVVCAP